MSYPLIVAGFHRSGTSLVCQLLDRAGVSLGPELLGADVSNPHGHLEDVEILRLHEEVLAENGWTWQVDRPLTPEIGPDHLRRMGEISRRREAEGGPWGFKDPRVCFFLPAWKGVLPGAKVVLVYRHPADAAYSLSRRHSTALFAGRGERELHMRFWERPDLALRMWLVHNEALLRFARQHPGDTMAVSHDALRAGLPVVAALKERWGLEIGDVATSEVFDPTVTGGEPGGHAVFDWGLVGRLEEIWGELGRLGAETEALVGTDGAGTRPAAAGLRRAEGEGALESELLGLALRYLEAELGAPPGPRRGDAARAWKRELERGAAAGAWDHAAVGARVEQVARLRQRIGAERRRQEAESRRRVSEEERRAEEAQRRARALQRRLAEGERRAAEQESRATRLEAQLTAAHEENDRLVLEVAMLGRWIQRLNLASVALLGSTRWRFGNALGEILRRLLLRSRVPMAQDQLLGIDEELRVRYEGLAKAAEAGTQGVVGHAANLLSRPADLPIGPPGRPSGLAEHVLGALDRAPPVTVVVPVHDAREDLERFLPSAVRNTTGPARLLLVDDASTDPEVPGLLARYEGLGNVRVLRNGTNLGFSETVNRGFAESGGDDVVIVNSDTVLTPRWLENMRLAAYADPRTATVTAISDKAGAFSVPERGEENETPEELEDDEVGRLVTQTSGQILPQTPTGNGFCMYVKRAALDEVGGLDAENFPRGYAEENDFCMRARKLGWNHVVDDATFVFHRRSASFGERKRELLETARRRLDELHPEYTRLVRAFVHSEALQEVGNNVRDAYRGAAGPIRPRVLFVIHDASGGTPYTNLDLMNALSDRWAPYLLVSDGLRLSLYARGPDGDFSLVDERTLDGEVQITEFTRPDYRAAVFDLLVRYRFELVHVRHLLGHTFDLPGVAASLGIPVVLSFHDFYFSCPTVHLIDDRGRHCGGVCTPGGGRQCTLLSAKLKGLPVLKHAWVGTWREQVGRMIGDVDAFVTTSRAARDVYLRSLPTLGDRPFSIIEHGRDLAQRRLAVAPGDGPIRILIPGNVNLHKGAAFIRELKERDERGRIEFHFLGKVARQWTHLGVLHGAYERDEFAARVEEISPSFMGIFSIWPETYCHTLTESWAVGVPVLASDIGTLRERVLDHGGGWLLDHEDPDGSYRRILEIAADRAAYDREAARADLRGIRTTAEMADDYAALYGTVLDGRRPFGASRSGPGSP